MYRVSNYLSTEVDQVCVGVVEGEHDAVRGVQLYHHWKQGILGKKHICLQYVNKECEIKKTQFIIVQNQIANNQRAYLHQTEAIQMWGVKSLFH